MWGWLLPPHFLTLPMLSPALVHSLRHGFKLANMALSHALSEGAGWTPQLLTTWRDGMDGAQLDCDLVLSEGILER